jgi:hypothetical protein
MGMLNTHFPLFQIKIKVAFFRITLTLPSPTSGRGKKCCSRSHKRERTEVLLPLRLMGEERNLFPLRLMGEERNLFPLPLGEGRVRETNNNF